MEPHQSTCATSLLASNSRKFDKALSKDDMHDVSQAWKSINTLISKFLEDRAKPQNSEPNPSASQGKIQSQIPPDTIQQMEIRIQKRIQAEFDAKLAEEVKRLNSINSRNARDSPMSTPARRNKRTRVGQEELGKSDSK